MKPVESNFSDNVLQYGTGVLNTDDCRIAINEGESLGGGMVSKGRPKRRPGWDRPWMHVEAVQEEKKIEYADKVAKAESLGRFPPNVIHDGSKNIIQNFPEAVGGTSNGNALVGEPSKGVIKPIRRGILVSRKDSGSAARFFFSTGNFDGQDVATAKNDCRINQSHLEQLELDFPQ